MEQEPPRDRFMPSPSCPLIFQTLEPCPRRGEPVTVGLPWPRGAVTDEKFFRLIGPDGSSQPLQTKVLDRWPDGSVRWCLFDFLATWEGKGASGYRVEIGETARIEPDGEWVDIPKSFKFATNVDSIQIGRIDFSDTVEGGPVRRRRQLAENRIGPCLLNGHIDEFASSSAVRIQLTIRNPQPAGHPGGNWDLGNSGSVTIPYFNFYVDFDDRDGGGTMRISPEIGSVWSSAKRELTLQQYSSGGANRTSSNHINRNRNIPAENRGYAIQTDDGSAEGKRATPIVLLENDARTIGVAVPQFWQNFPKRICASSNSITLQFFPSEIELQGGEQKTHTFYLIFDKDSITDEPMVWCRSPIVCHAPPEWYAASGAIPYLTPKSTDPNAQYLALVDQAIEGSDTFIHKREKIDEYGWRNFGDIYGDHEAVYHKGPTPLISHYNNQYDCVAGFFYQFFRSGDLRWLKQGLECADHTCDIDIYHTDGDKAAYNRGLFWHTYHYADADTGTHRSYPKSITRGPVESLTQKMDELGETAKHLKKSYAVGGGPASSNNYNTGLMLAYYTTGNPLYREGALELADYVLNIEDPTKTPFRFLSKTPTGLASESGGGAYHGPGRGPANSINALLVGLQLTGEPKYLNKAEELIRRVVHPKQNLERLELLNAELRWFYTMTLQAVGRYLDCKIDLDQLDEQYCYARLSLLHYAKWMAIHERPILDTPEKLQYPTETWAAQDMRKVEVFQYAAKHASGVDRAKYLERAEFFFNYVQNKLHEFDTKSLCRPVILMMTNGWSRNWWRLNPEAQAPEPRVQKSADDFGEWRMFVPQKVKAIRRAKMIVVAGGVTAMGLIAGVVAYFVL